MMKPPTSSSQVAFGPRSWEVAASSTQGPGTEKWHAAYWEQSSAESELTQHPREQEIKTEQFSGQRPCGSCLAL